MYIPVRGESKQLLLGFPEIGTECVWVVEIGGKMPRIEVAGDVCLRRPRPTQDSRAGDDDDYDYDNDDVSVI